MARVLKIPPALMSRWTSAYVDDDPIRRHINYDSDLRLDRPVYRYMSAQRLLDFLNSGRFHFSFVGSWVDPFEDWWHGILFDEGSPLSGAHAFASCWTWRSKDEPFWRLYEDRCAHVDGAGQPLAKGPPPVRIKSTAGRIIEALRIPMRGFETKVFLAPVGYTTTKELLRYRDSLTNDPAEVAREAVHALTYKRLGFQFEQEVRVLWVDRAPLTPTRQVPIDPASLIQEIMMGPVLEKERSRIEALRGELENTGFNGPIKRSLIYKPPSLR